MEWNGSTDADADADADADGGSDADDFDEDEDEDDLAATTDEDSRSRGSASTGSGIGTGVVKQQQRQRRRSNNSRTSEMEPQDQLEQNEALLSKVPLLHSVSRSDLHRLAQSVTVEEFEDGEVVIRQGDVGDCMYVIVRGTARVTINSDTASKVRVLAVVVTSYRLVRENQNTKLEMPFLCIYQATPHHEATSFNSNALLEFPQLLELTQKLCVLEDSGFTTPSQELHLDRSSDGQHPDEFANGLPPLLLRVGPVQPLLLLTSRHAEPGEQKPLQHWGGEERSWEWDVLLQDGVEGLDREQQRVQFVAFGVGFGALVLQLCLGPEGNREYPRALIPVAVGDLRDQPALVGLLFAAHPVPVQFEGLDCWIWVKVQRQHPALLWLVGLHKLCRDSQLGTVHALADPFATEVVDQVGVQTAGGGLCISVLQHAKLRQPHCGRHFQLPIPPRAAGKQLRLGGSRRCRCRCRCRRGFRGCCGWRFGL